MPQNVADDWAISIFVSDGDAAESLPQDPAVRHDSSMHGFLGFKKVVKVGAAEVQQQWTRTVDTLMKLSSTIADHAADWTIDEIEVGMTLSAKGELLFIAEAGAEASIKFVLKKKAA